MRFTTLSYLLAMLIAIAGMPLDIFQICRRGIGTMVLSPWQRAHASAHRRIAAVTARLRAWFRWAGGLPDASPLAAAVVLLLVVWMVGATSLLALPVLIGNLKLYRQTKIDLDQQIATNAQRGQEISKEIAAINAAVMARTEGGMTDEERAKLTSLRARQESNNEIRATLLQEKATNAARLKEAEDDNEAERNATATIDPDAEAARRAAAAAGIQVGRDLKADDPKKGFRTHTEFLQSVMSHGRGQKMDERLKPLRQSPQAAAGSDEAGVYSDPHGGFLVPEGFSPQLLSVEPEGDPTAGRTRPFPMATPVVNINARVDKNHTTSVSGGLTVTRRPETVAATSSRQEFERIQMRATSLFGLSYATEEIMTDSPISFITLLTSGFNAEFGAKALDEKLNGSGVGEFEGVNNSPAMISVSKEAGQTADTINYENVTNMRSRVWGYGRAIWMANHDTMPQLMRMVLVIGTGGSAVYQPSAIEDKPDLLLGRPIFYTEFCEKLGDAGDLLCVNWFEYLEGTYQPLQSAESMHVRFVEHERAFKFWLRNDGRGWWRSALTPKKSTATLSPFVRLAARA